jgi:hypothetical protein
MMGPGVRFHLTDHLSSAWCRLSRCADSREEFTPYGGPSFSSFLRSSIDLRAWSGMRVGLPRGSIYPHFLVD